MTYSDDTNAAWVHKDRKAYYGYEMHVATDSRDGFVLAGYVTPANRSDVKELPRLLQEVTLPSGGLVFANKGYSSRANREQLARYVFCDGIMSKAHRGVPLSGVAAGEQADQFGAAQSGASLRHVQAKRPVTQGPISRSGQGGTGVSPCANGLQPEQGLGHGQISGRGALELRLSAHHSSNSGKPGR